MFLQQAYRGRSEFGYFILTFFLIIFGIKMDFIFAGHFCRMRYSSLAADSGDSDKPVILVARWRASRALPVGYRRSVASSRGSSSSARSTSSRGSSERDLIAISVAAIRRFVQVAFIR